MLARENPPPEKNNVCGRPPVYTNWLLATICILMQLEEPTFRDAENTVELWGPSWNGGMPDHTTLARAFASLLAEWLARMVPSPPTCALTRPARHRRSGAAGLRPTAPVWRRTGTACKRSSKKKKDFKPVRVKTYLKRHSCGGGTAGDPVVQDDRRQRCGHHGIHRSAA